MRRILAAAVAAAIPLTAVSQPRPAAAPAVAPAGAPAPAAEAVPAAPPVSGLARTITLKELGFRDGLTFRSMSQAQTLYFPVGAPAAVAGMSLALPYRTASAFEARRSLEAWVGDRPVATVALPREATSSVITVPVSVADVKNGFLAVTLKYAGVATEDRCVDERAAGDYVTFAADDGLRLSLVPGALNTVQAVAAFAPPDLRVVLPQRAATAAEVAAALSLAAGARGTLSFTGAPAAGAGWSQTTVAIGQGQAPLAVTAAPGGPGVTLGGTDPAAGAKIFTSGWSALARTPAAAGKIDGPAARNDRMTLRTLGAAPQTQDVVGRADWPTAFSLKQLPAGMEPQAVDLKVVVPPDPSGESIVTASLNGQVIANARASWPGTTDLSASLPKGLATLDNNLIVSVIRQPRGGDCKFAPQGYPAQLVGSSAVLLGKISGAAGDFNALTSRFAAGVTVRLPAADPASLAANLPLAALAVQRLVPAGAPIKVVFGPEPLDGPFISIGTDAPAGAKPPVKFDAGAVKLTTAEGREVFSLGQLGALTTAQVVQNGKTSGLWLRPGPQAPTPSSLELDRGDVAFVDAQGVTMAFSSTRDDLIDVSYPEQLSMLGWLSQHRVWIILGVWLLATIGFLIFLQRAYRARRGKKA